MINLLLISRVFAEPRTGRKEHAGLLGLTLTVRGLAELKARDSETGLPDATPKPDAVDDGP